MVPLSTGMDGAWEYIAFGEPLDFVVLIKPSTGQESYRTNEQPFERE